MGNFDKKIIKQRRREEKQALKKQLKELKKKGVEITPEFKKKAEKAVRQYSVKQELSRRKRIFVRMGGKEEEFNEKDAKREILQDFRTVENSRLRVRIAAFLAAAGLTLGLGPKLLPGATEEARVEENGYEAGEVDEEAETAIVPEIPSDGEITIEVDPENPWIGTIQEDSKPTETVTLDNNDEKNISEEVYFKLKESSTDEIKVYCKNIYASIYQEKTGEAINPKTIEIRQEYKGYSYNVTLPNGQEVIILHDGNPLETKEQLRNISGIAYEKAVYDNEPYYVIYQKTPEGSKFLDGSIDGKTITSIETLKDVLRDEEQTINRSASKIPDNMWKIMVSAMTGDKNLSNEQLIELSRWIRDEGLEETVLGEQNEVAEHTAIEEEALTMANELEESTQEPSKRETFLGQLRAWGNESNATPSRESGNENTQQNVYQQDLEDDGR